MGFVSRETAGFGIVARQDPREERSETRGGFHQEVDLKASIADAVGPGMTREAAVRLVAPLEQMEHQDNQMGPECATFRCTQGEDLVDKVDNIERVKLPRLEARICAPAPDPGRRDYATSVPCDLIPKDDVRACALLVAAHFGTRAPEDDRTVNLDDLLEGRAAPNVDAACTGTTLADFVRASDLEPLPEDVIERYRVVAGAV